MKVVILGAGRRGIRLAKHLVEEKKDVVIIDFEEEEVAKAMSEVDCIGFVASGTDTRELREAGVEDADVFIALTGSDEINLVSCGIISSEFGVPVTIAAVRSLSYTEKGRSVNLMGITHIVNPYQEVANHIYEDIEQGLYSDIISFENSPLVLYNVYVDKTSNFKDKDVNTLRRLLPGQYIIAAVNRRGSVFVPDGDTVIDEEDTLSICLDENSAGEMLVSMGKRRIKPEKTVIIGATLVTDFLLRHFSPQKLRQTTVLSRYPEACKALATKYPELLVLNENITREGIFSAENLNSYDLIICATDNDELNILIASYAKRTGIRSSIALVNKNQSFIRMAEHLSIDGLLSAQDITVDSIVKYIHGRNISSIHSLFDGKLEVLEYTIPDNCPLVGRKLREINMKGKGLIVGARKPDGSSVLPGGNYIIENGDAIITVFERQSFNFIQNLLGIGEQSV